MKKTIMICLGALALIGLTGCSSVSPNAGHEAVLIQKPWIFGHGGVDKEPVKTGQTITALSTESVDVDMQPQQHHLQLDDIMSKDGVPLDFDAVIRLQVTDSVKMIQSFGPQWYDNNVEKEFMNRIRQAVKKHGMNETAISTTAVDDIDSEVTIGMEKYVATAGIPVKLIQITVGKANPPDSIKNQRIETATQEQRILTEAQKKLAEDARKNSEQSRAEADNAYRNAMQLSPDQFLRLETIKMQHEVCAGGRCTFIIISAGVTPIINTK